MIRHEMPAQITAAGANGISKNMQALRFKALLSMFVILVPVYGIISKFL